MSIAVLSDIHGNLEALEVAFNYIDQHNIEDVYCLGDIVGYGPNPNECVQMIRERCTAVLMGNHDYAAIGRANIEYFNDYAKMSTYWTGSHLSEESALYLENLPFTHSTEQMLMVHASPTKPPYWYYVLSLQDALIEMQAFDQPLCLIGHSHVPLVYSARNLIREQTYEFEPDQKYIVNVGSIGQPRDGNPKTCFTVFETDPLRVTFVRLEYDVQTTYDKIIRAGLPLFLGERLLKGY